MARLNSSDPWINYCREVEVLFAQDSEVHVVYNTDSSEKLELKLYVEDECKAAALSELMPTTKEFGNIILYIEIVPPNDVDLDEVYIGDTLADRFDAAFDGNPAVDFIYSVEMFGFTYVVFKNTVVQYYTDNLSDLYGLTSTLYQDIARDIFEKCPVFFSTNVPDNMKSDGTVKVPIATNWP